MDYLYSNKDRIRKNVQFVLGVLAKGKPGDSMVVIADSVSRENGYAICAVGRELGIDSILIDIDHYGGCERFMRMPVIESLRQAILHSDIALMITDQMRTDFGLFLGNTDECDEALLGHSRRYTFEATGLSDWNLDKDRILKDRERTLNLYKWLKKADEVHLSTARGTDLTCVVGNHPDGMYPVMAIIPFYAEVAVIPAMGSVHGTIFADGASEFAYGQRGFPIRPAIPGYQELYLNPLKLVFKDSVLVNYDGHPVQTKRLDMLLETVDPKPILCDEIGLVTTTSIENDQYGWRIDGSHQTHCFHVAIGNNYRRKEIIHAAEHVDFDVHDPVIKIDGQIIYENRVFDDDLIYRMGKE